MSFALILIFGLWVFSVFVIAKWRFNVALQKGVSFNALSDKVTMLYLKITGMLILLLIFYIFRF